MSPSTKDNFGPGNTPTDPNEQSFRSSDIDIRNNMSTSIRNKRRLEDDRRINRKKNDPDAMTASTRNNFGSVNTPFRPNQQNFGSRNVNLRNFQGQQRNVNANSINTSEGRRPSTVYSNFSPQGSVRNSFRDGRRLENDRNVRTLRGDMV